MQDDRHQSENEPTPHHHADPLARLSRFFRRPLVAAGELPPPPEQDDAGEPTAEFNVIDLRRRADDALFPLALWGGYDRDAVEAHIAGLEEELEELRAKVDPEIGAQVEIRHLGDSTAEILGVAHRKADAMVKKAQADSLALLAETEERTKAMVAEAEARVRRLDHDTDVIWAERMRLTSDTRRLAEQLMQLADGAVARFPPAADDPEPGAPEA